MEPNKFLKKSFLQYNKWLFCSLLFKNQTEIALRQAKNKS